MDQLKVVIIGAASPQWGYTLSRDFIVKLSEEAICSRYKPVLVLEDVDGHNLEMQAQLARKVADLTGNKVVVESTTDQRRAIEGARFVVTSFAQGTLEYMQYDLEIPAEYGIYQPVGDSISVGGAIRATRNIPAMLSIARDMQELGESDPWLLNLCNPMSILCRAVTRETDVNTVGCCHELYGGTRDLSHILDFPYEEWRERLTFDVLGVNHCAWMQYLKIDGEGGVVNGFARLRELLEERGITGEVKRLYNSDYPELRRVNLKINLFLRYGVFPYSGDRHNGEFFTGFVNKDTNKGADFGILLTSPQERLVHWRGRARQMTKELLSGKEEIKLELSQEASSRIMAAIVLDEPFYDVGNVPYHDDNLPGVPDGAVLERMMTYDGQGYHPNRVEPLPDELMEHLALHTNNIEKIITASVEGDRGLLIEALEADPLVKNMDAAKIPEMVDRLLEASRVYVHPGFF
jgi:alpha-galactosidase/6-phospho-beta-glucosidase family protein